LLLLIVIGAGLLARRKHPLVAFGIFWFFVALSVESSIFPIRDAMFEHRLYLPMVGFSLAVTYLVFRVFGKPRWAAPVAILVVVGLLGAATFGRNRTWSDPVSLWADVVQKNPLNARAYSNLGVALYRQTRFKEAIAQYRKALEFTPHNSKILTNYAAALVGAGEPDAAIELLGKAPGARTEDVSMHFHIGVALWKKGRFKEAEAHLKKTIIKRPDDPMVNYHYGYVLAKLGEFDRAAEHFSRVLEKYPGHSDALYSLGAIAFKQGRLEDAGQYFSELVQREPGDALARSGLSQALEKRASSIAGSITSKNR
jgi:Flp pilus assembly protein TadD